MPIDPVLEPLLPTLVGLPDVIDFDQFRRDETVSINTMIDQVCEPAPAGARRSEVNIPVEGGSIELHIFTPSTPGPHPAHLYIHGGGWVAGSIKHKYIDIVGAERAVGADCVVVAVEYRKAPEHKFPTGLNDCYAALLWIADHADELGVRDDLITVGGGSAGANLAAALTLKVRDEGGPRIRYQILEVPALDMTGSSPSMERNATGYGLTANDAKRLAAYYLSTPEEARNPYASPLLAADLAGLPAAYIISAEFDPLADDGEAYAQRLRDAGVPVTYQLALGQIHISPGLTRILPAARTWRDGVIAALRTANEQASAATT